MFTSLRRRFLFFFVGLAIVPILLVGGVVSGQSYAIQQQQALALQQETAQRVTAQVVSFMTDLEGQLRLVSDIGDFARADQEAITSALSQLLSYQDGFEDLALLDRQGQEQVRLSRIRLVRVDELADRSNSDEFRQAAATGKTFYSPLFFDQATREPLISIARPLTEARTGRVYGVLVGNVRLKKIWDLLRAVDVREGEQVYIIDDQGRVIAHRLPAVVLQKTGFERPDQDGLHIGLTGERVVLASVSVQFGQQTYYVVAEQWVSRALALAINTVLITGVVTTIALGAATIMRVVATRAILLPIENLAQAAQAIEAGDLSVRSAIHSRDEIGVLSKTFNSMAVRLGQTLEGLEQQVNALQTAKRDIQQLNTDLERRVNERTVQLREVNERLTELDRLKSRFIADLSHELRTPISVLNTRIYLMQRGRPEKQAEYLRGLQEQVDLLTRFVESVFDLSRLDLGKDKIEFELVDLNTIVSRVVDVLAPRADAAGLTLTFYEAPESPKVRGEPNQLSQVITNLITNAIQYTPAGHVDVRLTLDDERKSVSIRVRDTGIGINPEDQPHVFNRFYRGANVGQSTLHGIGLGLSVAHDIVKLHRGEIHIESQLGVGSIFTVQLPLDHAPNPLEHLPQAAAETSQEALEMRS
jgi:signal transduction histidine kinase